MLVQSSKQLIPNNWLLGRQRVRQSNRSYIEDAMRSYSMEVLLSLKIESA